MVSCSPVEVEDGINDEACELVNGVEISIGEGDDSILACLFMAVKNNNGTGILLLSDVLGFEDASTRDFAYRKLGIIGFCFGGGRLIDALTQDGGACFGIGVSFYGTRIDLSVVANIKVPVSFIVGDNDPSCLITIGMVRIADGIEHITFGMV
ncbi:unnamed protein product [Camellia sinensis]